MSVIVAKRKPSKAQFIDTARELYQHTLRYTNKQFNKSDRDLISRIRDISISIFQDVLIANSIYPTQESDNTEKRNHFLKARGNCYALIAVLSGLKDEIQNKVTHNGWIKWGVLASQEIKLLTGLLKL